MEITDAKTRVLNALGISRQCIVDSFAYASDKDQTLLAEARLAEVDDAIEILEHGNAWQGQTFEEFKTWAMATFPVVQPLQSADVDQAWQPEILRRIHPSQLRPGTERR